MTPLISPPPAGTYAPYQETYIRLLTDKDPIQSLSEQMIEFSRLLAGIPPEREEFRYAAGKWTLKEVVGHINDTERIMAYRALSFARGELQSLPGFDENEYVRNADFNARSLDNLLREYRAIRESTLAFYSSLDLRRLDQVGTANGHPITPRSLLYVIYGHNRHHELIIRERYL
ncbi:MAG: hypothetical protein RL021_1197 [Bacteroidota bacterium]|jgi:uncharacterized damage-inducible protein DinB